MTKAEDRISTQAPGADDLIISLLGGLSIGGMVWGFFFALAKGIEFAAGYFSVSQLTTDQAKLILYYAQIYPPLLVGLLAAYIAYRWLLNLK